MSELSRQTRNKLPTHLPDSLRRRSTTPLMGFQGSIIGPVSGLVTYEDGQRIENEINDLNRVAANLSHLVGRQTHVIRAQFEEMHGQLEAYEEHQKEFRSQLMSIQEGMYQVSAPLFQLNYTQMLTSTLHALEMGLDEYLRATDQLLEIVYSARRGMLNFSLLTPE